MKTALPALLLVACTNPPMPSPAALAVPPLPVARESTPAAGELLRSIADRYWTVLLAQGPVPLIGDGGEVGGPLFATELGDHRFDDRLDDVSPAARTALQQALGDLRTQLGAVQAGELGGEDLLTLELLRDQIEDSRASYTTCGGDAWLVDPVSGPQLALPETNRYYPLATAKGRADLAARYRQAGRLFDQMVQNLRQGLAQHRTSPVNNVRKVIAQLDALIADPAVFVPKEDKVPAGEARTNIELAVREQVVPGLRRYRDFLRGEELPQARTDVGLWALPGGDACYRFLIRHHAGVHSPQELHELGLAQLQRIEAEERAIAGPQGLEAYRKALAEDPRNFRQTADGLLRWNEETLARALAALPQAFLHPPPRPITVQAMPPWRAPQSFPAYYQPAPDDGSQPAGYTVNLYRPETRALYNEEALCFHEAVPGHHLQISTAQELHDLPAFRRHLGPTAFIEGWALYAERLADEPLHLYSGPPARFGMLGYQAWRASRLVVDTGMHALRWSREQALEFLRAHTTLSAGEAGNEVDRYVTNPAQALAYMVGEQEIFRLRTRAQQKLGPRFDLRQFHETVLRHGALPLPTLARVVDEWLGEPQPPSGESMERSR